ncbi:FMN-binding protein [uncultured Ruminococcus sp.]|uniref:FMN-binding protein n=1 Tax=uncultured Ruminococcus sp. TaxID=165186 RepID=UPI00266B61D6|nr:FMN-binding protein [uncultured Ruminococcus sp.]
MHRFWIKTCNLILVVALLFGYQAVVQSRAQKETIAELEYELQQKTVSGQPEEADGADSLYADGTYTGEAQGYGGTVAVELTVENGKITDLTITSAEKEDTAYLDAASAVIDSILEQQSTDVDTVSGATFSSNGILHAAEDALRKAEKNHA